MRNSSTRTHQCHAACCRRMVPYHLLMCAEHWRLVPQPLQKRVNDTFRNGATESYHAAVSEAKKAVRAILQPEEQA